LKSFELRIKLKIAIFKIQKVIVIRRFVLLVWPFAIHEKIVIQKLLSWSYADFAICNVKKANYMNHIVPGFDLRAIFMDLSGIKRVARLFFSRPHCKINFQCWPHKWFFLMRIILRTFFPYHFLLLIFDSYT